MSFYESSVTHAYIVLTAAILLMCNKIIIKISYTCTVAILLTAVMVLTVIIIITYGGNITLQQQYCLRKR